jgi:flagellar biosynthetic protein FliO
MLFLGLDDMTCTATSLLTWLQEAPTETPDVPSYGSLLLQTVLALILVCVLAYVFLRYGLRWLMRGRKTGLSSLAVLDRLTLDSRRTLYVVEAAGKVYLLGATDASVRLIAELDPDDLPSEQSEKGEPPRSGGKRFIDVLMGKRGSRSTPNSGRKQSSGDDSERSERE